MTRDEIIKEYEVRFKPRCREFANFEIVDFVNSFIGEVQSNMIAGDIYLEKIFDELTDYLNSVDEEA